MFLINRPPAVPGVYVVRCPKGKVIDVGQSKDIHDRISTRGHPRKQCWEGYGYTEFLVIRAKLSQRKDIEQELRRLYNPPKGRMSTRIS